MRTHTHLVDVIAGDHHKGWDVCCCTAGQTSTLQGGSREVEHLNLATDASKHCSRSHTCTSVRSPVNKYRRARLRRPRTVLISSAHVPYCAHTTAHHQHWPAQAHVHGPENCWLRVLTVSMHVCSLGFCSLLTTSCLKRCASWMVIVSAFMMTGMMGTCFDSSAM